MSEQFALPWNSFQGLQNEISEKYWAVQGRQGRVGDEWASGVVAAFDNTQWQKKKKVLIVSVNFNNCNAAFFFLYR